MLEKSTISDRLTPAVHRVYFRFAGKLRSDGDLHRLLFGFTPEKRRDEGTWDWTTLVLRGVMHRRLRPGMRYLDMGCGPCAVLALYAALRLGCGEVWAMDHIPSAVSSANKTARGLKAPVHLAAGDLFTAISGAFDFITFNAPYIEPAFGRRIGVLHDILDERRFAGGEGGTETIRRFIAQCPGHLSRNGIAALGANSFYLKPWRIESLLPGSGLRVADRISNPLTLSYALLLEKDR